MPAAAVIPALIAYIKVVAVKKLVVESRDRRGWSAVKVCTGPSIPLMGYSPLPLTEWR